MKYDVEKIFIKDGQSSRVPKGMYIYDVGISAHVYEKDDTCRIIPLDSFKDIDPKWDFDLAFKGSRCGDYIRTSPVELIEDTELGWIIHTKTSKYLAVEV